MLAGFLDILTRFPHESVPDGYVLAPHHAYVGLLVAALAVWVVSDNKPHREMLVTAVGCALLLFGFLFTWKWYAEAGAALSLAGVGLMLAGPLWPGGEWAGFSWAWRLVALLGALVAADDVIEHAFGVPTPLDKFWVEYLAPVVT